LGRNNGVYSIDMPGLESEEPDLMAANTQEDLPQAHTAAAAEDPATTSSLPQQTGDWHAAYDHISQRWYYYNLMTGERGWDPPPDWVSNHAEEAAPSAAPPASNTKFDKTKPGYYYRDAYGIDQGPFSIQQLLAWRGALPMDLPVWEIDQKKSEEKEENEDDSSNGEALKNLIPLAEVLGDADLLAQWRTLHPEITQEAACAAPSAVEFRNQQHHKQQKNHEPTATTDNDDNADDDNIKNEIDFATSLAEAVIAGLPPDDEAVQLSRVAASAGQSLHEVVEWTRKQSAARESYTVTAVHTAGRGRIQAVGGERESLYADMGSWIDPTKMEEQMKKASNSAGKRKMMTAAEVKAAKARKEEMKMKKQRAWLQD
jgi:hypothetical protein